MVKNIDIKKTLDELKVELLIIRKDLVTLLN